MGKIKLLCLPYAGSSAMFFWEWKRELGVDITLVPLELAGRGRRIKEKRYEQFQAMLEDVYDSAKPHIEQGEYAIFGHSMGATLAFELVRKIEMLGKSLPSRVILSGASAPSVRREREIYSELDDDGFIQKITELGGMREEILANKELMSFVLPIIRADFKVLESYKYLESNRKLPCKASVFYGVDDDQTTDEDILPWQTLFEQKVEFHEFEGNHFFINEKKLDVISKISQIV